MIPYIIIALCVIVPCGIVAYSLGYHAGIRDGFRVTGLGTRHDSRRPVCGRTLMQIDTKRN